MSDSKVFADGLICKRSDNAPEYVIVNLSVKVSEFTSWLEQHEVNGWVNVAVKRARSGKIYAELDAFTPNRAEQHAAGMAQAREAATRQPEPSQEFFDDDLPF